MKKVLFFVGLLFVAGCNTDVCDLPIEQPQADEESCITDGMTVLGEQLENPYSVANMRRAMANLAPTTRSGVDEDDITTTHYYVKFHPQSDEELDILLQDSTINFYDIPLDYEIEEYGTYYHDPSIPDSLPTYQYASIPADKWEQVKDIAVDYEVLSDLFIPDEYSDDAEDITTRSGQKLSEAFVDALVDEALALTGNEEPVEGGTRASDKWTPSGRITYFDDVLGETIGLQGVQVKARRWFTTHKGIVNAQGDYKCDGAFKRPANYSFELERYDFKVKGEDLKVKFDGPEKKGPWNYHFAKSKSPKQFFVATIFRAAYHYYYKDISGLRRPPQNSFLRTKMKLKAFYESDGDNGNFDSARRFMGGNMIKIYNPDRRVDEVYAAVIHELAHAAHWRMIVKEPGTNRVRDYHDADIRIVESWAPGVQWFLTKKVYVDYKGKKPFSYYTNVVMDMVDDETNDFNGYGRDVYAGDKVSGYNITEIEASLIGCDKWNEWRNNIKNKYNNETEKYLDELFAAW